MIKEEEVITIEVPRWIAQEFIDDVEGNGYGPNDYYWQRRNLERSMQDMANRLEEALNQEINERRVVPGVYPKSCRWSMREFRSSWPKLRKVVRTLNDGGVSSCSRLCNELLSKHWWQLLKSFANDVSEHMPEAECVCAPTQKGGHHVFQWRQ